jgi:hypothetical protein
LGRGRRLFETWQSRLDGYERRRASCNIPRFYQILGNFFCFCFAWDVWKFTGI